MNTNTGFAVLQHEPQSGAEKGLSAGGEVAGEAGGSGAGEGSAGGEGGAGGGAQTGGGGFETTHSGADSLETKEPKSPKTPRRKHSKPADVACEEVVKKSLSIHTAAMLAGELGVGVEAVADLMQQCAVPDEVFWSRVHLATVATDAGREKILGAVQGAMLASATKAPPVPAVPTDSKPITDSLTITRMHGQKRVLADRKATGREVVCCMQSTEKFKPGMVLEGAFEGEGGLWFYQGRMPRGKGRW